MTLSLKYGTMARRKMFMKKQSKMIIFKLHNLNRKKKKEMLNREIPINIV
jgi:hypothetical protein